jgi:hypothetical protein
MYDDAPELCGFEAQVELLPDMADGAWHVALFNVIGKSVTAAVVRLFLDARSGRFESIGFADLDSATANRLLHEALDLAPAVSPEHELKAVSSTKAVPIDTAPPRRRARR